MCSGPVLPGWAAQMQGAAAPAARPTVAGSIIPPRATVTDAAAVRRRTPASTFTGGQVNPMLQQPARATLLGQTS